MGGFFTYLYKHLQGSGFEGRRIAFNGGDVLYALGSEFEVAWFSEEGYEAYFRRLYADWRPDAILLFGDERPIHKAAKAAAARAKIPLWCFEEGYIRPNHVTFEPNGNNANSPLFRTFDPTVTPPATKAAPRLTGQTVAMGLRAWGYFVAYRVTRWFFPGYTHHRERRLSDEFRFWIRSAYRRVMAHRHDEDLVEEILSGLYPPFFIVALQVHDDLQLRRHGRGWRSMPFTEMVLDSFKRAASPTARLVVKAHPLDVGHGHHRKNIRLLIRKYGLEDRVEYLQSGPLMPIVRHAKGLVTINSTAGIVALRNHVPVIAFGDALYHISGLSVRPEGPEDLDRFWNAPPPVDATLAWRFGEHMLASVLLPGSFYLRRTWPRLADDIAERLRKSLVSEPAVPSGVETTSATAPTVATITPSENAAAGCGRRPRIGIASSGIWRRREMVATLLDGDPVQLHGLGARDCDVLVGWGQKATSRKIRALAMTARLPYVALEDGFLRSVRPGTGEAPIGWIVDRTGIYYNSHGPSDLERAIIRRAGEPVEAHDRALRALAAIRELRLSKYNHAPMLTAEALGLPRGRDAVMVIDQTFADASVSGSGSDGATFARMIDAAIAENPGVPVAVKIHPETISGTKRGYLTEIARRRDVVLISADVNPWALIENARRIYVVSSQLGLEAMLAGVPVTCFGAAAYAGWGVTDDRIVPIRRRHVAATPAAIAAAAYLDYCRWIDPYDGREIDLETAIDRLAFLRDRHLENRTSVCVGFSRWKRKAATNFLTGFGGPPIFVDTVAEAKEAAEARDAGIVVWGSRDDDAFTVPPIRAEDGFLRSVGLGASFVAPASLVFDDLGIYYDPRRPSRFEVLAETASFDAALVARAERLRHTIVERRLSKYNDSGERRLEFPKGKLRVLVPGQVEDDASIRLGSPEVTTNLELLRRVRARWPEAHIVYKPHPDVQAGYRLGRIPEETARVLADQIVTDVSMPSLLAQVDRVETMTSLTGFEALLRGLAVTTHGVPFYAGWGLTEDLMAAPRRTRRPTLDELVATTLILYPRYVDPKSGRPCPVEVAIDRLTTERSLGDTPTGRIRRRLRTLYAWTAHNVIGPIWKGIVRR